VQWPDDLGPLHGDPASAQGNLAYAFGQRGDRRSHAIGDAGIDRTLKSVGRTSGQLPKRENLAERHVRFLAPLAYLSPRIIEAIAEGQPPAGSSQEKQLGFA
jgi:hypothetical protein